MTSAFEDKLGTPELAWLTSPEATSAQSAELARSLHGHHLHDMAKTLVCRQAMSSLCLDSQIYGRNIYNQMVSSSMVVMI